MLDARNVTAIVVTYNRLPLLKQCLAALRAQTVQGFTVLLVTHDVSEAVAMADRVLLIEDGKIGLDLTVDLPRPRRVGSARLAELEAEVLDRVMKRGSTELQRAKANA